MATIMVADDDLWIRYMLRRILEREGHTVLDAQNGLTATDLCRKGLPDLAVTDMHMSGQDGFETIVCLRRDFPWLPIIAISEDSQLDGDMNLKFARDVGAECVLTKPFAKDTLLTTIRDLLSCRAGGKCALSA